MMGAGSQITTPSVGGLAWQFALSPRMAEAQSINTQAMDVETQNVMLINRYNEAVSRALDAPKVAAEAQALFAQMPQNADLPQVLDQIMNAATDAGIDETGVSSLATGIPQLVPASEAGISGVQLATMSISVSADGKATSTMEFLDNLQTLDRALLIRQVSVSFRLMGSENLNSISVSGSATVSPLVGEEPSKAASACAPLAQPRVTRTITVTASRA